MTSQYKVATGHDVVLGSLALIVPQPATIGLQYTRRQYAASGVVLDEYPFVELRWSMLDPASEYQTLLSQHGLSSVTSAPVSVYVQDERFNYVLRNATAVLPLIGSDGSRNNFFLRDFVILLKNLRAQA